MQDRTDAKAPPGQRMKEPQRDQPEDDAEGDEHEAGSRYSDEEPDYDDDGQGPPPEGGVYATLHGEGPMTTPGSVGHPDKCQPCTFYCFTRRGCNRAHDCRFCHLTHQSKLQQRREAWKRQQREKRKSIRERMASDQASHRKNSLDNTPASPGAIAASSGTGSVATMTPKRQQNSAVAGNQRLSPLPFSFQQQLRDRPSQPVDDQADALFCYSPSQAILTIGQQTEFVPRLAVLASHFRLTVPLPPGLYLDPVSGIISGAPLGAHTRIISAVEADLPDGRRAAASLELEVVDFTRGGFVIGHMSEYEPGKYMLLMYVPEEREGNNNGGGRHVANDGAGPFPRGHPRAIQ